MAHDEKTTQRIRQAFLQLPAVEEKKMFSGITFMVNGKMCISVGAERIMCRIDPAMHEEAITKKGAETVVMKRRPFTGYVHVAIERLRLKKDLDYWVALSLAFNEKAKPAKKKSRK